jgi:Icc-related predicted phosphoesterase
VTPFGSWSYDLTEDEARELLAGCPPRAVVVTHSPPKGAVDRSGRGASLGSLAVLEIIERTDPRLVVCGHIHESAGQTAVVGRTPVINAGPRAIAWELER